MFDMSIKKVLHKIFYLLLIISAINDGIYGALKINPISWLANKTAPELDRILHIFIGLIGLLFLFKRDYYLPFLGETVFPSNLLDTKEPTDPDYEIKLKTKPNKKIIYWGAETHKRVAKTPHLAYGNYSNSGIVIADNEGNAILKFRNPGKYKVYGYELPIHIHYRIQKNQSVFGPVHTINL